MLRLFAPALILVLSFFLSFVTARSIPLIPTSLHLNIRSQSGNVHSQNQFSFFEKRLSLDKHNPSDNTYAPERRDAAEDQLVSLDGDSATLTARQAAKPFLLRVLPLGASITFGLTSGDGNGYRKHIRNQWRWAGWNVDMVGAVPAGNMKDNDCEGHVGAFVHDVAGYLEGAIQYKPNVVLVNAGTNDAIQNNANYPVDKIDERMNKLLDRLFDAIPGVTVVLSTLLVNGDTAINDRIKNTINPKYREIAIARRARGQRLVLADMYRNTANPWISTRDLRDGTHPTDEGYKKMASVWWSAFQDAENSGFLQAPANIDLMCSTGDRVQTQRGSGTDDGNYVHASEDRGRIYSPGRTTGRDDAVLGIHFAQLINTNNVPRGGELDELVWTKDNDGTYMFRNLGGGSFADGVRIDVKSNCWARDVRWGDINNDGLDDFICIGSDGRMLVSINRGGSPPQFESLGVVMPAPAAGLNEASVRVGDIDGDGRLDYCVIRTGGALECWRNGGQKDAPLDRYGGYWEALGQVFSGNVGDITGVRLVDLNGDFRSDILSVDDTGRVTTWINNRGVGKGSITPDWRETGVTHNGMGVSGVRNRIKFGRVYDNGGRKDYIYLESVADGTGWRQHIHVWRNLGKGGTMLKSDGNHYCDMRGTGADDYVWIDPNGKGQLYGNIRSPPSWDPAGPEIFNINRPRKSIHLADFDGDGKCDIWAVRQSDGAAEVWQNNYDKATGQFNWRSLGFVTGGVTCTQGWGVGYQDLGMRFADVDGDRRADYLCIEPDGRVTGGLNKGVNAFSPISQFKFSEGKDRANHRFADVNGDGFADFLWTNKFNGDTQVWLNKGHVPSGGSQFTWTPIGKRYEGVDRGSNLFFPQLGGRKRADLHAVVPRTNEAYTWWNTCGNSEGDDGAIVNPQLPNESLLAQVRLGSGN